MSRWWLRAAYLATAVFVTWQENHLGHVGNLVTFRTAAQRLVLGENLYGPIAGKLDYLYSPSFAILFAPFAIPPFVVGLLLWNLVNAAVLLVAVERLLPERRAAAIALALVWPTMLTSLQNTQSNALVAGLVVLAFLAYEADRPAWAGLAVAAGAAIKIFPVAAAVLGIFRRGRARWILALAAAGLVVLALPLLVTSPATLLAQYRWWLVRTGSDLALRGDSVIGILSVWLGYGGPSWAIEAAGAALVLLPLALRRDRWGEPSFRRLYLCSLLVFMVIFNHNAESPSYVIAMTGIAVWYATARRTAAHHVLIALALLIFWVATEAIVPGATRAWIREHSGKATVSVLCWILMQRDLLRRAPLSGEGAEARELEVPGAEPFAQPG
jgi:Glycosyltransferase family 87